MTHKNKSFKLSLIAAACLGVAAIPVHAGKIVGVQQADPSAQAVYGDWRDLGYNGWNLGNIDVKIVDVVTGDEVIGKTFEPTDGSYDLPMEAGDTFISVVNNESNVETGILHGKDWPVGEPSGLKVLTNPDINAVLSNSKPASCLMSTSYHLFSDNPAYVGPTPDDGFLDSANPNPTLCNSPFQTHKRFKVDATTPVAGTGFTVAEPIDLVFNTVDSTTSGEIAVRRYMVLQKLNNYSDRRFTGYTVEVGFGIGSAFQTVAAYDDTAGAGLGLVNGGATKNLALSIGIGENAGDDVWAPEDLAVFSAGLFGPADPPGTDPVKHPIDGFFDDVRAGYNIATVLDVDGSKTTISSGVPLTDIANPSNYVNIFGAWLPSKWTPHGIFFDDDHDPATDAQLVAFWGVAPGSGEPDQWLGGYSDIPGESFLPIPEATLVAWATDTSADDGTSLYSDGEIEDLLNLGLSYIVEVGDVDTFPGSEFTLRMTPIAAVDPADIAEPGWVSSAPIPLEDYIPAPVDPVAPPVSSSSSGGCVANPNATFDPLLPAILLSALGYLGLRRRQSSNKNS